MNANLNAVKNEALNAYDRMNAIQDRAVGAFKKTNLFYTENNLLKFQDPLYIGFKLFFLFDQPESGLLSTVAHPNTALNYLEKRGYTERAAYLKSFINLLKGINSECPWFWQSIEGLDEAWKHGFNEDTFLTKVAKDKKITINTLDESIDFRITALMDLYRKACFDWPNRREVVPRNLRYFSVAIYCYEARSINKDTALDIGGALKSGISNGFTQGNLLSGLTREFENMQKLLGDNDDEYDPNTAGVNTINYKISRLMFDFNFCEWLPDESGVIVNAVSHKEMANKAQKIVFSYGNVAEDNLYRMHHDANVSDVVYKLLDKMALDDPKLVILDKIKMKIAKFAQGKINNLLLGNAYGFSPLGAVSAVMADPKQIISEAKKLGPSKSMKNGENPGGGMGSIGKGASIINNSGDAIDKIDTTEIGASKKNKTLDYTTIAIGNAVDQSKSLSNSTAQFPPNSNIYFPQNSIPSVSNGNDKDPKGNYGKESPSIGNGNDKDPSGNYGNGSPSIGNGKDINPKGNAYK